MEWRSHRERMKLHNSSLWEGSSLHKLPVISVRKKTTRNESTSSSHIFEPAYLVKTTTVSTVNAVCEGKVSDNLFFLNFFF